MAFQLRTTGCCGVLEIEDISLKKTAAEVIEGILEQLCYNTASWRRGKPFIYFTGVVNHQVGNHATYAGGRRDNNYAEELAQYIEQNKLGTVIRTIEPRANYTGNLLKPYIWTDINYQALSERYQRMQEKKTQTTPPSDATRPYQGLNF